MTIQIEIADGVPYFWESQSIIPGPANQPSPAATAPPDIHEGSTGISVYVRVDNTGTEDLGAPTCPLTQWKGPAALSDYDTGATGTHLVGTDYRLELGVGADQLVQISTGAAVPLGRCLSSRRAWGLSPDSAFFAFVSGPTVNVDEWRVQIVPLPNARDNDGNVIAPSFAVRATYPSTTATPPQIRYTGGWDNTTFGWVGSRGLFTSGTEAISGLSQRTLIRFRSTTVTVDTTQVPANQAFTYLASPCGSTLAYVPPAVAGTRARWVSTDSTTDWTATRGNVTVSGGIVFSGAPTITTISHTLNGVNITNATTAAPIDDPDQGSYDGGLQVQVGRKAYGTVTSGNDYYRIGQAAGPRIAPSGFAWIEVPQANDWLRHGVEHWCFLAQAWEPNLGIPRLWPETGTFPYTDSKCAQRNFSILL